MISAAPAIGAAHWRFGPQLVSASPASTIVSAIDAVFSAFRIAGAEQDQDAHPLALSVQELGRGFSIAANGAAIGRVDAIEQLAPFLEGALIGVAVRSRRDALALHAAAVRIDGRLTLLLGEKGSGKSSVALWLAENGAEYLGDELCFLRFSDLGVDPFPKAATLKSGAFDLFAPTPIHHDPSRGRVRYVLPGAVADPSRTAPKPARIVLLHHAAELEHPRARQLSSAETALALVRQSFGGLERDARSLDAAAALSVLPAFLVELPDLPQAGPAFAAFLSEGA